MPSDGLNPQGTSALTEAVVRQAAVVVGGPPLEFTSAEKVIRRIRYTVVRAILHAANSLESWNELATEALVQAGPGRPPIDRELLVAIAVLETYCRRPFRRLLERLVVLVGALLGALTPWKPYPDLTIGVSQMRVSLLLRTAGKAEDFAKAGVLLRLRTLKTVSSDRAQFRAMAHHFHKLSSEMVAAGTRLTPGKLAARYSSSSATWRNRQAKVYGAIVSSVRETLVALQAGA